MPIYEYRRPDGSTFEVMQRMADDALTIDPDSGVPVERVLHAPAIHFKGKGFYNTDYGTKRRNRELRESAESGADKHEAKQAEKKAEAAKSSDGAAKSDAKPKAEKKPASEKKSPKK
ncbi:MAG TPA: FmdB family zinc ribbon protein [Baekduia sp.]|jgi:putative FmdB family regulatory protein|nr:FmdB family zinc ribbon protein [Baekduia sp.]